MAKDISIKQDDIKFNFRVAGYIEYNNKVLLHILEEFDFWNLVGGRVKYGETTLDALKREMKEEIDLDVESCKLINVSENFFGLNDNYHELLFVYRIYVKSTDEIVNKQDFKGLDREDATYHWFDKDEIKNVKCLPPIIYDLIGAENFTHTYERDGKVNKF